MRSTIGGTNPRQTLPVPDGSRTFEARDARDPATLTAVYRAHSTYVWRVLRHCGVPDADLDDAVQETFLVVFRRLPEWQARASLRTWIYAIAVRVASTRRRSQHREAARRQAVGEQLLGTAPADPEHALSRAEAAALVDRLLDELDDTKRTVFVLAELEGVKVPEISQILGVNPRTVHSRLRLARESFGSALRRERAREQGNLRVARLRPRALLEHAANDRPATGRRKAAWSALALRIEQGQGPTLPGWESLSLAGSPGASVVASVMTWVLPAVLGAAGIAAIAFVTAPRPAPPTTTPSPSPTAPPEHARAEPTVQASHSTRRVSSQSSPAPALAPRPTTEPTAEPTHAEPTVAPAAAPAAVMAERRPFARTPREPTASPAPSPAEADPSVSASTLAAETRLLEQARGALRRGDATAALAALEDHLARFPRGILLDEARSTRLRALCAAGRRSEANALAERLAPGQPDSRWHDVVAAACR